MEQKEAATMDGSPALVEVHGSQKFDYLGGETEPPFIRIKFQAGPVPDGVNGCSIEDVIDVLINRLLGFQSGPFNCIENARALDCLKEARDELGRRTAKRQEQGVEGTMAPHKSY